MTHNDFFFALSLLRGKRIQDVINKENQDCKEENFIASYLKEMKKRETTGKLTHLSSKNKCDQHRIRVYIPHLDGDSTINPVGNTIRLGIAKNQVMVEYEFEKS